MGQYKQQLLEYVRERIEWAHTSDARTGSLYEPKVFTGSFGSSCLLPPWAFNQTPVVKAVNQLSDNEKTLIKFVVGLPVDQSSISNLLVEIYFKFYRQHIQQRRLNASSVPKAQRLVEFALMNHKLRIANQPSIKNQRIMQAISIKDDKSYRSDWAPRLSIMSVVISDMENTALNRVLATLDKNKKEKRRA